MSNHDIPCLVCGKSLVNLDPEGNQPRDGLAMEAALAADTSFSSGGHYGCGVFDPMDGTFLEINVCDSCLGDASMKGRVLRGRRQPTARPAMERWRAPPRAVR